MLAGEALPGLENCSGAKLQSQTRDLGWHIDDLLASGGAGPDEERQLAISCKAMYKSRLQDCPAILSALRGDSGQLPDPCERTGTA